MHRMFCRLHLLITWKYVFSANTLLLHLRLRHRCNACATGSSACHYVLMPCDRPIFVLLIFTAVVQLVPQPFSLCIPTSAFIVLTWPIRANDFVHALINSCCDCVFYSWMLEFVDSTGWYANRLCFIGLIEEICNLSGNWIVCYSTGECWHASAVDCWQPRQSAPSRPGMFLFSLCCHLCLGWRWK